MGLVGAGAGDSGSEDEDEDPAKPADPLEKYRRHLEYLLAATDKGGFVRLLKRIILLHNELVYTQETAGRKDVRDRELLPGGVGKPHDVIFCISPSGHSTSAADEKFYDGMFYANGINVQRAGGKDAIKSMVQSVLCGDTAPGVGAELDAILLESDTLTLQEANKLRAICQRRRAERLVRFCLGLARAGEPGSIE